MSGPTALPSGTGVELQVAASLATMPAALLVADARRRLLWANPLARALLRRPSGDRPPLESCGLVGRALHDLVERMRRVRAMHEWWCRIPVPPAGMLQSVSRRTDADSYAFLLRCEEASQAAHEALVAELGLLPAEARLALRVHRGLPIGAISTRFGIAPGSVRMRLLRLRRRLGSIARHDLFVTIDDVLAGLPLAPAWPSSGRGSGTGHVAQVPARVSERLAHFLQSSGVGLALCDLDGQLAWANTAARGLLDAGVVDEAGRCRTERLQDAVHRLGPQEDALRAAVLVTLESAPAVLRACLWQAGGGLVGVTLQSARLPETERGGRIRSLLGLDPADARLAGQMILGAGPGRLDPRPGAAAGLERKAVARLARRLGARNPTEIVYALRRQVGAPLAWERPASRPLRLSDPAMGLPAEAAPVRGVRAIALGSEVSNRVLQVLLAACLRRGLVTERLVREVGLGDQVMHDDRGRHSWEQFASCLDQLSEELADPAALRECMADVIVSHEVAYVLTEALATPLQIYTYGVEQVLRSLFRHLGVRVEPLGGGRLRIELGFPAGYQASPGCWRATGAVLGVVPRMWQQADALVEVTPGLRRAVFLVTPPGQLTPSEAEPPPMSQWLLGVLDGATSSAPPTPATLSFRLRAVLDASGLAECSHLLGQRLADRLDLPDLAAELCTVLDEQFLARRAALWANPHHDGTPVPLWSMGDPSAGRLEAVPLMEGGAEVGRLDVEPCVARSPLFRALLPWIAVGLTRVTSASEGGSPADAAARVARVAQAWELTPRQREVLALVVQGRSNRDVAATLGCSTRAIEVHLTRLLSLTGVPSRAALIARVWRSP